MSEIYVDTDKMRACGNEILALVEEFKATLDTMFTRIENVPIYTKEWVGDSAMLFVSLANKDKVQYYNYATSLYKYGKYLIDCADYYDKTIKSVRRD